MNKEQGGGTKRDLPLRFTMAVKKILLAMQRKI
jgi:hypothetical protein